MIIGIIGGGASGMAAALAASRSQENQVILFERQARLGRKLLATGNGRCNLSNLHAGVSHYHGEDPGFAASALIRMDVDATLAWFAELGLYTVTEESGKVYPYSDQANSVVDVLRFALERPNVRVLTGCEVTKVRCGAGFTVETTQGSFECDKLIVACGGLAGTKLGGSMSGYKILRSLGHRVTKLRSALVQVKSDWSGCNALKGVRANCRAAICHNGEIVRESMGELQFTQYGLSGPVIFEISRDVCTGGQWSCILDFMPYVDKNTLQGMLERRRSAPISAEDLLTGLLHNRLGRVLVASAGIPGNKPVCDISDSEILTLCDLIKGLEVGLTQTMGMDCAQVTAGGVYTEDFDPQTMESRLVPGLYACGEVLDIDGDCGGFNLQWAWSSGHLAGTSAGEVAR